MIVNKQFVEMHYSAYKDVKDIFYFSEILKASDSDNIFLLGLQSSDKDSRRDILCVKLVDEEYKQYDVYVVSPIEKSFIKLGVQYGNKLGSREFFFNKGSCSSLF